MVVAIYARKSTEQTGVADEARSVTRQVEHARAYAIRKGWAAAEEHVYTDDGVSGALFGASRPGLARLLNALTPRPAFQVLVMSEESRLGREAIETGYTLKRITDAGVAVWFYLEDRQRSLDTAMDKVMMSLSGFASEMERERGRQRTHDALLRKARGGHVTGGLVFGYSNVRQGDHVARVVETSEAVIVRRIFEHAASGWGYKRIAATLNVEAAAAPQPRRAGRPRGWAPSSVREVLFRELYRGVIVWNQTQKIVRRGAKGQRHRPAGDVLRVDAPALRIVPEELWRGVHDRLDAERSLYQPRGPRPGGRPVNGLDSPYLLTGLGACAQCGGSMFVHTRSHGRARVPFFGCMTNHLRGAAICANTLEVPLLDTDQAVLTAIEDDLLRIEVLETSLAKALEALQSPGDQEQRGETLRDEQARLEVEVARLAAAIAAGGDLPALVALLRERERRRGQVQAELAALGRETEKIQPVEVLLDQLREHLARWRATLHQETGPARQALRALLAGRLAFTAVEEHGRRGYRFEGPGTLDKVIEGVVSVQQNGWWPQEDSNPWFSHDHVFARDRRTLRLAWFRRCRSTAYGGTHPPQESPGTAIGRRPMMSWRNGGPGHQGRGAGRMQPMATIEDPAAIQRILAHRGLPGVRAGPPAPSSGAAAQAEQPAGSPGDRGGLC